MTFKKGRHDTPAGMRPAEVSLCKCWCGAAEIQITPDLQQKRLILLFAEAQRIKANSDGCGLIFCNIYIFWYFPTLKDRRLCFSFWAITPASATDGCSPSSSPTRGCCKTNGCRKKPRPFPAASSRAASRLGCAVGFVRYVESQSTARHHSPQTTRRLRSWSRQVY